jgi:ABC-type branched-subunit amino acid transport system substrate-binding protein/cytochrome c553
MKPRLPRVKYSFAISSLLLLSTLICVNSASTQSRSELSAQEKRGKQIYVKGGGPNDEITATLADGSLEVPASSFSCSNCHGLKGEGTREGGLQPPPIDWATLTKPYVSALTRRERVAYHEATLTAAITNAIDPVGRRLHPAMPRYKMTREQMADLIAYLKQIGKETDHEPGITDEVIRIGAALPLSGPLAQLGEDVSATLAATFAEVNAQGGIYGRRFELVVEDSRGDPSHTLEATRKLIEERDVFALLGSLEPGDSSEIHKFIRSKEVPLVGPLTLSPSLEVPPNPFIFYLLPTLADQTRALVDFANSKRQPRTTRLGVVYSRNEFNEDALAGVRGQAALHSMKMAFENGYERGNFKAAEIVELIGQNKPDYLFFFGGPVDFKTFAEEMDRAKLSVPLLSSAAMVGRGAFSLPASVSAQTFLSYPSILPNETDFAEFLTLARKSRIQLRSAAFQSMAFAATKILLEGAKQSGKQIDRATLVSSLEQIRDFKTGVVPPVTFGPNRRVGSAGSYIVEVDAEQRQYLRVTDRLTPQQKKP